MPQRSSASPDDARVLTVTELTALVKEKLEAAFSDVYVMGEISDLRRASSGHVYLTLKDANAVLRTVIWRGVAAKLPLELEEGIEVLARGSIDVYAPRGSYQLIVSWMEPKGLGDLQLAYRRLLEKLEKEGLFKAEHKKPLPSFPQRIGVVTSPTGAAVRDIINVLGRRFPAVEVYIYPSRVQGQGAAEEIATAIARLNEKLPDLDLIIVGRGGGSLEDLWAFNEEAVARAIFDSAIPIVSAVGHEIDFSISDFVADVRAATPTEAAEIVVPDRAEVLARLDDRRKRLAAALQRAVEAGRQRLHALSTRYVVRHPDTILRERAQRADDALERLKTHTGHRLSVLAEALGGIGRRLETLDPRKVLERGYSITLDAEGAVLRSVEGLKADDTISSVLHRGTIRSKVTDVAPASDSSKGTGPIEQ